MIPEVPGYFIVACFPNIMWYILSYKCCARGRYAAVTTAHGIAGKQETESV